MDTNSETRSTAGEGEHLIEEMLLMVTRSLADHPEAVEVDFISDEDGHTFQIQAHERDLGRLIGKNGQTAKALELIINANRRRTGRRYRLDIVESGDNFSDA